jgi:hypothetical protein
MTMRRSRAIRTFTIALLAVLLTVAGAPAMVCASMADCPMMEPATPSCHGAPGTRSRCAAPRVEAADDCCTVTATPPIRVLSVHVETLLTADAEPAVPFFGAPAPPCLPSRSAVDTASPPGPAGRNLLSLHQTLLI